MRLYREAYVKVLKKNFMLLIIAIALVVLTFGFWFGIPIIANGNTLSKINTPIYIQVICMSISVGIFLSLFFIPFHLEVAKKVGEMKTKSTIIVFSRLHLGFVLFSATVSCVIVSLVLCTSR